MNLLCPNCSRMLTVPDQYAGQIMRCPLCSGVFTVPDPPAAPPQADSPSAIVSARRGTEREPTRTHVGDCVLQEQLGQGGMGEVWRAVHQITGREVAVKLVRGPSATTEGVARFQQECQIVGGLYHPHVVGVIGSGSLP